MAGLCVLLTGCADPAYMEARRQEMDRQDHATCVGYGTVAGTAAYDDCRRDLAMNRARNYSDGYYYSYYNNPYPYDGHYDNLYPASGYTYSSAYPYPSPRYWNYR